MLGRFGGLEWVVILLIVILVFGPGRIGKIAGELGHGIKSFRDGLANGKKEEAGDDTKSPDEPK